MAKKTRNGNSGKTQPSSQRRVLVFASLLAVMTVTSALLLALAPAPLAPGAVNTLFAVGQPASLDTIFQTPIPVEAGRWRYVFVHHSKTDGGSAATLGESADGLADHFVIGNGAGCGDGEVQVAQRWHRQKPAGRVTGVKQIDPSCVSICLIGDFDRALPTPTQELRLLQLVTALQERCGIRAEDVHLIADDGSPAGVGRHFPVRLLRERLLP